MDLIFRNARIAGKNANHTLQDIGIKEGRIAEISPKLSFKAPQEIDLHGNLLAPGFIESHIHLDKSCILDRCKSEKGDLEEAIEQVALAKKAFTSEDVYQRGAKTIEKCIAQGTTHIRTHLEVDPGIGLRGLEGVLELIEAYKWAIDLEVCVFPQEGLLNNPGTDELMVEALKRGARVVGAAPYTDTNPYGQIDRVFELAREFDADIDMHLDFGSTPENLHVEYVCDQTDKFHYGGRVTVGHLTKMSMITLGELEKIARRMSEAGVAATVLPSTDLYLMGRNQDHNIIRGVTPAHKLLKWGVNCSISSNNVLNPFTPFGDCSLIRMANLYANICQVGKRDEILECFEMITHRTAKLMRLKHYGLVVGNNADLVVIDSESTANAVAELSSPLYGFKRGRMTFKRSPVEIFKP